MKIILACLLLAGPSWLQAQRVSLPAVRMPLRVSTPTFRRVQLKAQTSLPKQNSLVRPAPLTPSVVEVPLRQSHHADAAKRAEPVQGIAVKEQEVPMESILQMQGWLLGILAQRTGQEPYILSIYLAGQGHGLSLSDYKGILDQLVEIEAAPEEIKTAVLEATEDSPFAKPLGPDNSPSRSDALMFKDAMLDVPEQVEMTRNKKALDFIADFASGKLARAFGLSARVKHLSDGRLMVFLGVTRTGTVVEPIVLTFVKNHGDHDMSSYVDSLLRSPFMNDPQVFESVGKLSKVLEQEGLLPPGYTAKK